MTEELQAGERRRPQLVAWAALVIIIGVVGGIRVRLIDLPLERDEGEFAYMGQLMLQGVPPYAEAYNMKLPGIYAAYALTEGLFGETIQGVHWGLLLVNSATILLLFLLGKRLFDAAAGIVAAGAYGVLSLGPSVLGLAGHATHFVLLPAAGGMLLLLRAMETGQRKHFFLSGILFGLGILMKQPALFLALFAVIFVSWRYRHNLRTSAVSHIGILCAGILLPYVVTCLWLAATGVFDRFWFWTVTYAAAYGTRLPVEAGIQLLAENAGHIVQDNYLIVILAGVGAAVLLFSRRAVPNLDFLVLLFICSFSSVCPGLYFRPHYFILLLPAVALILGAAAANATRSSALSQSRRPLLAIVLVGVASAPSLWQQRDIFFSLTPPEASRAVYGLNPFPESLEIADSVNAMTSPGDRIAVFGSEPQLYFYSHRRASTGYIYMYSLTESQPYAVAMQHEMASQTEHGHPSIIVFVNHHSSWLGDPSSATFLLQWAMKFLHTEYDLIGIIDMVSPHSIVRRWHDEVNAYRLQSPEYVLVFRRRQGT